MNDLMQIVIGWLGYLERPTILLQLLLVAAAALTPTLLRRTPRRGRLSGREPLAGLALLALGCLLLRQLGAPSGLAETLGWLALGWLVLGPLRRSLARVIPEEELDHIDTRLIRPGYLVMALLVLIQELDNLGSLAVIPLGRFLGVGVTLGKLASALVVTYLLLVGSQPPAAALAWLLQRCLRLSDGSRRALELMLRYLMVALGLITVADHLGLNTNALIAVAGGLSVGLGFGIKEVFSNFVSGLWLLFEGSVRPGEVLMIDGDPCEVRRLGLRATLLWRDRDNAELLVPNQTFFTEQATTYTATDRMRRSQVSVGAAYHHDPARVIALLEATALEVPRVLKQPAAKALMLNYGDSAINYALRFWIANPMDNVGICSEVNQAVWRAFEREGIEIPFPQQVQYEKPWPPAGGQDAPPPL
ncbi:MAG: mechanosensitive ion channel family protein [Cyanobium sp.]